MAAIRISGQSNLIPVPKKASTVFPVGSFVTMDAANGWVKPLTQTDPSVFGVIQQPVSLTDVDYANTYAKLVDQGMPDQIWQVDVQNGGSTAFSTSDIGQFFKMGGNASGIDCNTRSSTAGAGFTAQGLVFLCVGFVKATTLTSNTSSYDGIGLFKIMSMSQVRPAST